MKKEQDIERIYDLVEMFDFNDLSENDKEFVLKHISYKEYNDLRSAITDSKVLFSRYQVEKINDKLYHLKKIAMFPVELYKIAATILIITGAVLLYSRWGSSNHSNLLAMADTVFVKKTDTILVYVGDTAVQIKEISAHKETPEKGNGIKSGTRKTENIDNERDCSKELCPKDIQKLGALKSKNDFSNDKALTDFIVTIN